MGGKAIFCRSESFCTLCASAWNDDENMHQLLMKWRAVILDQRQSRCCLRGKMSNFRKPQSSFFKFPRQGITWSQSLILFIMKFINWDFFNHTNCCCCNKFFIQPSKRTKLCLFYTKQHWGLSERGHHRILIFFPPPLTLYYHESCCCHCQHAI